MTAPRTTTLAGLLLLASLLAGVLPPGTAEAQESKDRPAQERPLLEQVRALKLDSLQTGTVTVHFSPGHRDRAERLGARVDRALQFFADSLGAELEEFHLLLPDEKRWDHFRDATYGMPGGVEDPPAAILPADARGIVFEHYRALEDCLAPEHRTRLKQMDLSWKEAAGKFVEMITFHEIGHRMTDRTIEIVELAPFKWFGEFLAGYFSYAYLLHNEPKRARVWDLMSSVNLACYTPEHRTLEALALGLHTGPDYVWYQSNFEQRANRVVENHGFEFIREVREAFPPQSSAPSDPLWEKVDAFENDREALSEEEAQRRLEEIHGIMLRRLEQIAPGFEVWAERFQRDEGAGG